MQEWSSGQFKEIWVTNESDEQAMCALINGEYGWLMYLREEGDAGFSSRNPEYDGSEDAVMEFCLSSGQMDTYPMSWVLPADLVYKALAYFEEHHKPPAFIMWYDDRTGGEENDTI